MALRKIAFVICLVILILSLVSGYIIAGQWIGAVIAIIIGSAWLLAKKYPNSSLLFICLLLSVCLAVAGRLIGSPPLLMICSSGAALVVWDLLFLDRALGKRTLEEQTRRFEHQHLQSLMIAVGVWTFDGILWTFIKSSTSICDINIFYCPRHARTGLGLGLSQEKESSALSEDLKKDGDMIIAALFVKYSQ